MHHHDALPWVLVGTGQVKCNICKAVVKLDTMTLEEFIRLHATHEAPQTHYPIGDVVAKAAKAIGFKKPCSSCEKRRYKLNRIVKR
jgi:hypothetical protein